MYKIGQILTAKEDVEVEKAISGNKDIIKKGTKVIIGADGLAHHIHSGMIQPLADKEVNGYDCEGLAEYLFIVLKARFPLKEMMEDYEVTENGLREEIEYALDEIGL